MNGALPNIPTLDGYYTKNNINLSLTMLQTHHQIFMWGTNALTKNGNVLRTHNTTHGLVLIRNDAGSERKCLELFLHLCGCTDFN